MATGRPGEARHSRVGTGMINVLLAPERVYEAFIQGFRALGMRLLSGEHP